MPARTAPRLRAMGWRAKCSTVLDWKGENKPVAGSKVQRWSRDLFHRHDSVPEQETWILHDPSPCGVGIGAVRACSRKTVLGQVLFP
jgi:hypothetical protein